MKRHEIDEILRSTDTGAGKNSYLDEVCVITDASDIATPNFTIEIFPPHEDDLRHAEVMCIISVPTPQNAKSLLACLRSCRGKETTMTRNEEKLLQAALDVCSDICCFAEMECPGTLLTIAEAEAAGCQCDVSDGEIGVCPDSAGPLPCWRIVVRYRILKQAGLA